jgi:hypothetical protein
LPACFLRAHQCFSFGVKYKEKVRLSKLIAKPMFRLTLFLRYRSLGMILTDYINETGFKSKPYVYIIGWCLTSLSTGADAAAHVAEEAKRPTETVPMAIFWSTLVSYILGWIVSLPSFFLGSELLNFLSIQSVMIMLAVSSNKVAVFDGILTFYLVYIRHHRSPRGKVLLRPYANPTPKSQQAIGICSSPSPSHVRLTLFSSLAFPALAKHRNYHE